MTSSGRVVAAVALTCVGIAASGCSNTASQILETGSIFGGAQPAAATPAAPQVTPTDRALQVAAVSARAQKCGYVFDPAVLRRAYLASEAATGLSVADLGALGARYDFSAREVAKRIAPEAAYCSPDRTKTIKADLNRHLAGDFRVRKAKPKPSGGILEGLESNSTTELNPNWVHDQSESPTRQVKN